MRSRCGVTTSYTYQGVGMDVLLSASVSGGVVYTYAYGKADANGLPVIATRTITGADTGDGVTGVVSDPVTGSPVNLLTSDGSAAVLVVDGVGNQAAAVTDAGETAFTVEYDPYGTERITSGGDSLTWVSDPFGYKLGIRDATDTGLTKFGARWETATTGAWLQRDTLDAPLDPGNANRYAFVGCDPINGSDATGNAIGLACGGEIAFGIALIIAGVVELPADTFGTVIDAAPTLGAGVFAGAALATAIGGQIAAGVGFAGNGMNNCGW